MLFYNNWWILVWWCPIKVYLAADILAVFPIPGLSHFNMFGPVLKELARRGHNVDVVSHFPLKTPKQRYTDISIRGSSPIFTNNMTIDSVLQLSGVDFAKVMSTLAGTDLCKASFKTPQLIELKKSTKKYDLVISELFGTDCMLGWAWHFGVPSVVMTSSANLPWAADRFGLPDNPSYIPNYFVGYGADMDLYERLINTWTLLHAKIIYNRYSDVPSNQLAKEFFGPSLPDLEVLARNTSLQLVNTHFSVNIVRPTVPNVVEVGGVHIQPPKPLNEHFNSLLNTADQKGIIYFTMGSVVLTETLPQDTIKALFEAFSALPYKIIWKGDREKFPKELAIPLNIHFESWMPQLDILCDPRVSLFVSHGGMMGTQEAVHCGVPILGVPLFADQKLNMKHAQVLGYAIMVPYEQITREKILGAANQLLNDPKYKANAKQISSEFKDRPLSAMDTAVYWIEYVIRHKGAARLQSTAKHLPWYQYYLLDVIAALIAIPLVMIYLVFKLCVIGIAIRECKREKIKTT